MYNPKIGRRIGGVSASLALVGAMFLGGHSVYAQSTITPVAPTATVTQGGKTWTLIENADQLAYVDSHQPQYLTANLALTSNINMAGWDWVPIGSISVGGSMAPAFAGTFNGQGYTVSGVSITNGTYAAAGFFGVTDQATLENLTVAVDITDSGGTQVSSAGALVGFADGSTLSQVAASGMVTVEVDSSSGGGIVGGLIGGYDGITVQNAAANVAVTYDDPVGMGIAGGLAGGDATEADNDSTFTDVYTIGSVSNTGGGPA